MLIVQGRNDPRVPTNQSEDFVRALNHNNIPNTYLLYPDEGHGLQVSRNIFAFTAILEVFLVNCFNTSHRIQPFTGFTLNMSSVQIYENGLRVGDTQWVEKHIKPLRI